MTRRIKLTRRQIILATAAASLALSANRIAAAPAKKDVVILGATAQSAPELIKQALAQGRRVRAVARRPDAITMEHPNLSVLKGDVREPESLEAAFTGKEVVISLVGPRIDPRKEINSIDLYSLGTTNIVNAMKKMGNKRLLVCSSIGIRNQPTQKPNSDDIARMAQWNTRKLYADMIAMEKIVRASGLEYVILRPGRLMDVPARHNLRFAVEELTMPKTNPIITIADFAQFVLTLVEGTKYLGTAVAIFSDVQGTWGRNLSFEEMWKLRESQGPIDVY